jgi:hypothetical protein
MPLRVNARRKIRLAVNESGGWGVLFMPNCGALMETGLCGATGSPYNGGSFFVTSFHMLLKHR